MAMTRKVVAKKSAARNAPDAKKAVTKASAKSAKPSARSSATRKASGGSSPSPRSSAKKSVAKKTSGKKPVAKTVAAKRPAAKKSSLKKAAFAKTTTKSAAAGRSVAGKSVAKKTVTRAGTARTKPVSKAAPKKSAALKTPSKKLAVAKVAGRVIGKPAARPLPSAKASARKRKPAPEATSHISPEQAVAHIQALLEAKHERDRQGPTWPGAEATHTHAGNGHADNMPTSPAAGLSSEAAYGHALAHQRGDQGKRKG